MANAGFRSISGPTLAFHSPLQSSKTRILGVTARICLPRHRKHIARRPYVPLADGCVCLLEIWVPWEPGCGKPGTLGTDGTVTGSWKSNNRDKAGPPAIGGGFPGPSALLWGQRTQSQLLNVVSRDLRFPPFAQNAKDGAPRIPGCLGFMCPRFRLIVALDIGRDPSLGVARFASDSAASG